MADKSFIETERGEVMVEFSRNMATWVWTCIYGCNGFDYEGQAEATRAFDTHTCPMGG